MDRAQVETLTRIVAAKGSRRVALAGVLALVLRGLDLPPTAAQCHAKEGNHKRQCRRHHQKNNAPGGGAPQEKCAVARSYNPATRQPNLSGRDLSGCDLSNANLSNANLFGADLRFYNLGVNLSDATLNFATLSFTNLNRANFFGAGLFGADLSNSDLRGANLRGATLSFAIWRNTTCPDGTNSNTHLSPQEPFGTCEGHLG